MDRACEHVHVKLGMFGLTMLLRAGYKSPPLLLARALARDAAHMHAQESLSSACFESVCAVSFTSLLS
eukprot:6172601-Pleurochrysis_carterae.AAC.4